MSKKNKPQLKSNCCNAKIKQSRTDNNETTCVFYSVCSKCLLPCNIHLDKRKTWNINPKTRIVPNKKKIFTDKELRKLLKEEDF